MKQGVLTRSVVIINQWGTWAITKSTRMKQIDNLRFLESQPASLRELR